MVYTWEDEQEPVRNIFENNAEWFPIQLPNGDIIGRGRLATHGEIEVELQPGLLPDKHKTPIKAYSMGFGRIDAILDDKEN